jgi:hypothetical protein
MIEFKVEGRSKMEIQIKIESKDKFLEFEMFKTKEVENGETKIGIADGIQAVYGGTVIQEAFPAPSIFYLTIEVSKDIAIGVAAGLISAWLYDKLKGKKVNEITIEMTKAEYNEGEIKRIIIEKFKQKSS